MTLVNLISGTGDAYLTKSGLTFRLTFSSQMTRLPFPESGGLRCPPLWLGAGQAPQSKTGPGRTRPGPRRTRRRSAPTPCRTHKARPSTPLRIHKTSS